MSERIVPPPTDPMAVARVFVADNYIGLGGALLLRHHRNTFYRYAEDHWPEDDDRRVRSELWTWLEDAVYEKVVNEELVLVPFAPTRHKVANVQEALTAIGHVPERVQPPVWLFGAEATSINAGEVVSLANGILDLETRKLGKHTPELFAQHVLPFEFDRRARRPSRWLQFLDELWGDDQESKSALGEWFGYVLSNATEQQKAFMLVGPKRSGKGTIARVLTGLLGVHNVAAPTLASLAQNFGLQVLIGKPLAVISDARLGTRADTSIAVERLLSITGEDTITIDRKYRDPWTGRVPSRFMILTNELPRFADSSGALASRFVVAILTRSFYGNENPRLTSELLGEAPSIFNWSLKGLDRLRERGYFVVPSSAQEAQRRLEDLASPVGAFVRDCCDVGPAFEVEKDALWTAWKAWCLDEGRDRSGTKAVFARDLNATVAGLASVRPRDGKERSHLWRGVRLRDVGKQWTGSLTTPDQDDFSRDGQGSSDVEFSLNRAGGQGWSEVQPNANPADDAEALRRAVRRR
jgi:putative DNA primase/helicase